MEKCIAFKANIYKAGIQSGHQFLHFRDVDVADSVRDGTWFVLIFYESFILE